MLELFVDHRQCRTQAIHPSREDSMGIALFGRRGRVKVLSLDAWKMAPANPY